jgi:hypothetical protein
VARYGQRRQGPIYSEVEPGDVPSLLESGVDVDFGEMEREIDALHELQERKVLDLARRLNAGLTQEDVKNPHDFPELHDPDWHYADGVLHGIASVRSLLAARRARRDARPDGGDD